MSEEKKAKKKAVAVLNAKAESDKEVKAKKEKVAKADAPLKEDADPSRIKKPGARAGGMSQTRVKMGSMLRNRSKAVRKYYPSKCKH